MAGSYLPGLDNFPSGIDEDRLAAGLLAVEQGRHSQQSVTEAVLVSGVDATLGEDIVCTLTANRVLGRPLNGVAGQRLQLVLTQGGAGNFTLTAGTGVTFSNFALNATAGAVTTGSLVCLSPTSWVVASNPPSGQSANTLGGALLDYGGWAWNIKHSLFGAKGGAQMVSDGAMTNGSAHVTSASALFAAADVGKSISVAYALSNTIGPGSGGFGTITAFNSATDVTVSFNCTNSSNPTAAEVTWGYDDTPAVRAAIAKVQTQGRGAVLVPGDTFIVCPQTAAETYALSITASNVEIMGLGTKHSRLWFRVYQMKDPKSNWQNNAGAVLRGNGVQLISQSTTVPLSNVTFRDFEIDGDAGYTGNNVFPANISTGDGWDITMKGFGYFDTGGVKYENVKFINVHSHSWRGENVYAGGTAANLGSQWVLDCELNDTNGDGISVSTTLYAKRNHIYKHASHGFDNGVNGRQEITDNYIHDCDLDGINIYSITSAVTGPIYIEYNRFLNCQRAGIDALSLYNAWIRYNVLIDCGWSAKTLASINIGQTGQWGSSNTKGIHVTDNQMWCDAQNLYTGLTVTPGATSIDDIEIDRNFIGVTAAGIAAGKNFAGSPFLLSSGTITKARIKAPFCKGTTFNYSDNLYAYESLLTGTGATDVVKYRPPTGALFEVLVSFRVITGATNVTINVTWYDAAGVLQTKNLLTITSEAVGNYQMAPLIIAAASASEAQYIKATVTAGTANQVYVSASIREAF